MPESKLARVGRLAERSAERSTKRVPEPRAWTITKFGRHSDGYLHARVTPAGEKAVYVHRRYGSWMIPVDEHGQMREVLREVAVDLQVRARALERTERRGGDGDTQDSGANNVGQADEGAVRTRGGDQGTTD